MSRPATHRCLDLSCGHSAHANCGSLCLFVVLQQLTTTAHSAMPLVTSHARIFAAMLQMWCSESTWVSGLDVFRCDSAATPLQSTQICVSHLDGFRVFSSLCSLLTLRSINGSSSQFGSRASVFSEMSPQATCQLWSSVSLCVPCLVTSGMRSRTGSSICVPSLYRACFSPLQLVCLSFRALRASGVLVSSILVAVWHCVVLETSWRCNLKQVFQGSSPGSSCNFATQASMASSGQT